MEPMVPSDDPLDEVTEDDLARLENEMKECLIPPGQAHVDPTAAEPELEPAPVLGDAPEVGGLPGDGELGVCLHRAGFDPTGFVLDCRGTGDLLSLQQPAQGCVWAAGEHGPEDGPKEMFIAQYHSETRETSAWADVKSLLPLSLHRSASPPDFEATLPVESQRLMIRDKRTGGTAWRSEQRRAKVARGVVFTPTSRPGVPPGLPPIQMKLWIFQVERAPSAHLM
jgi:hypothetical protein